MKLELLNDDITIELLDGGLQGPPGLPGVGGSQTSPPYPIATALSALRVVCLNDSNALILADSSILSHAFRLVGLMQIAVSTGTATPLVRGILSDGSWNWDTSKPIWLGTAGFLTQTPPVTGFQVQVATPLTTNTIHFEIQEIVEL